MLAEKENKPQSKSSNSQPKTEFEPSTKEKNSSISSEKTKIYNLIILDKSGSMYSKAKAAVSGFNETVGGIRSAQQRYKKEQEHFVSLFTFCECDKSYVFENVPVDKVEQLTMAKYRPCCNTPLYDAMGQSLNRLLHQIQNEPNSTAVVTVITDGWENASREFSGAAIQKLVEKLQNTEGWNFAYMGTNQDVDEVADGFSISNRIKFEDDSEGMAMAWKREKVAKLLMYERMCCDQEVVGCMSDPGERKLYRARRNREVSNYLDISYFKDRITPENISSLKEGEIFVFGSNLAGRHAGGAARVAVENFGAVMGQGVGLQGQCYAIPTMQGGVETIEPYVDEFLQFAKEHPDLTFLVTRIGCGIAGFKDEEIAPLFLLAANVPNIHLPKSFWKEILGGDEK